MFVSKDIILKSFSLDKNFLINNFIKKDDELNKNFYKLNGAIYICKVNNILKKKLLIKKKLWIYYG